MKVLFRVVLVMVLTAVSVTFLCLDCMAFDPSGEWNFSLSNSKVKGMCPMGGNSNGVLEIENRGGGQYTLRYISGMTCSPAQVCILHGSCNGSDCMFRNSVSVDNQGGKVANSADLHFDSDAASGPGKSQYIHPAMSCSWDFTMTLSR